MRDGDSIAQWSPNNLDSIEISSLDALTYLGVTSNRVDNEIKQQCSLYKNTPEAYFSLGKMNHDEGVNIDMKPSKAMEVPLVDLVQERFVPRYDMEDQENMEIDFDPKPDNEKDSDFNKRLGPMQKTKRLRKQTKWFRPT